MGSITNNITTHLINLVMQEILKEQIIAKKKQLQAHNDVIGLELELEDLPSKYKGRGSLFLATKAAKLTEKRDKIIKENPSIQSVFNRNDLTSEQKREILQANEKKLTIDLDINYCYYKKVSRNVETFENLRNQSIF